MLTQAAKQVITVLLERDVSQTVYLGLRSF